jgi:hypothetical protein
MPCGIIYHAAGHQEQRRYQAGDLVRVCRASECREDPAPGTPLKILILSDAEPIEMETLCQERSRADGSMMARSLCSLNTILLPLAVQASLQSRGRATCTKAEFLVASFNKELDLQLSVSGLPPSRPIRKVDRTNEDIGRAVRANG